MKTQKVKTYVIIISRTYMEYHPKKGQQTNFVDKINLAIGCPGCNVEQDLSGKNISQCNSCVKAILNPKLHTFRGNYELWKKRIDEVLAGNAVLVIKYHTLGRYVKGNEQIEFARFDKASGIGIQEAIYSTDYKEPFSGMAIRCEDGVFRDFPYYKVAENDGLSLHDFSCWFEKGKYDLTKPMACIHFTSFRYDKTKNI